MERSATNPPHQVFGNSPSGQRGLNLSINGFRGLCASLVFLYHVINAGFFPSDNHSAPVSLLLYMARGLTYGVEMFFMISGFVIMDSLRRHASLGKFLVDRTLRIFPLWLPIHLGICLLGPLGGWRVFHDGSGYSWSTLFWTNLVFINPLFGIPPTHPAAWSLTYEWMFYLVAAASGFIARAHRASLLVSIAWCVSVLILLNSFPRAMFFIPGVILALYPTPFRRLPTGAVAWLAPLVFWLCWRYVETHNGFHVAMGDAALTVAEWLTGPNAAAMGACAIVALISATIAFSSIALERGTISAIMRTRLFQFLGSISFSFYLWHPIVMFAVKKATYEFVVPGFGVWAGLTTFAVVSLAISIPLSYASWRLLERALPKLIRPFLSPARPLQVL